MVGRHPDGPRSLDRYHTGDYACLFTSNAMEAWSILFELSQLGLKLEIMVEVEDRASTARGPIAPLSEYYPNRDDYDNNPGWRDTGRWTCMWQMRLCTIFRIWNRWFLPHTSYLLASAAPRRFRIARKLRCQRCCLADNLFDLLHPSRWSWCDGSPSVRRKARCRTGRISPVDHRLGPT